MFTPSPNKKMFQIITGDLSILEGYYLHFDKCEYKWIRSGNTSVEVKDAYFDSRRAKHEENSKLKDQVRVHPLYREYPARGANIIGVREGHFENLALYCGMA